LSDWVSLGDETILGALANAQPKQAVTAPLPPGVPETWILTRLHTRYDKATLSDDLVFRVARPMTGGTANADGTNADEGATPSKDGRNRFQGRYIIRHYWEGPVACENPHYGIWTGPPANQAGYRVSPGVAPVIAANAARARPTDSSHGSQLVRPPRQSASAACSASQAGRGGSP